MSKLKLHYKGISCIFFRSIIRLSPCLVDYEEWYFQEVRDGLTEVEQGEIATEEQVAGAFKKWGVDAG